MRLDDYAAFIKSTNAGATALTFDIGLKDAASFERLVASKSITPERIAAIYRISPAVVQVYEYRPACIVKVTIPRPVASGGIEERDFDGVQQFAPLLDLEVTV